MANYNRVILMGHLTSDPELKYIQQGTAVVNFGLAINRGKEADFFDCEAWEKTAELISEYLKKGSGILIEGRLKQERWEKDGQKYSRIKILVGLVQFLSKGEGKGDAGQDSGPGSGSDVPF